MTNTVDHWATQGLGTSTCTVKITYYFFIPPKRNYSHPLLSGEGGLVPIRQRIPQSEDVQAPSIRWRGTVHTVGPPRPLIPSCGSNIPDFMDVKLWDTEGRLYVEKNPRVTGPVQFKPMFRVSCVHTMPFCPSRTFLLRTVSQSWKTLCEQGNSLLSWTWENAVFRARLPGLQSSLVLPWIAQGFRFLSSGKEKCPPCWFMTGKWDYVC